MDSTRLIDLVRSQPEVRRPRALSRSVPMLAAAFCILLAPILPGAFPATLPVVVSSLGGLYALSAQQQTPPPVRGERMGVAQGQGQGQGLRGQPQEPGARQAMMLRIQRDFERRVARALELTPPQLDQLRGIAGEFRSTRGQMMRERFLLRQEIERHARSGGSEAEARRLLDRTRALRARELDVQRQEEERLLSVLSPTQLLRFHQLREEFSESIRRLEGPGGARRGGTPPDTR